VTTIDTLSKTSSAAWNGSLSQSFVVEYTRRSGQTDWESSRDDMIASSPTTNTGYDYFRLKAEAHAGTTQSVTETMDISLQIDEIELENGHIYTPTGFGSIVPINGQGGEIHLPWPDNDAEDVFYYGSLDRSGSPIYGLQRATAGTVDDISKTVYGINSGHFAIRTHDLDRQFALLAGESGAGNSGVWVSSDAGDTWVEIVTPSAVTPYQAAFGGDDESIIFVWGPAGYIKYSSNFGASLDSRAGNLGALSATKLIGIAGGPTP
jgi:hypothetical protein